MTRAGWPQWLPATDRDDPDVHLVFSAHGGGVCGAAVAHIELPQEPAPALRCAVCAAIPVTTPQRRVSNQSSHSNGT